MCHTFYEEQPKISSDEYLAQSVEIARVASELSNRCIVCDKEHVDNTEVVKSGV